MLSLGGMCDCYLDKLHFPSRRSQGDDVQLLLLFVEAIVYSIIQRAIIPARPHNNFILYAFLLFCLYGWRRALFRLG